MSWTRVQTWRAAASRSGQLYDRQTVESGDRSSEFPRIQSGETEFYYYDKTLLWLLHRAVLQYLLRDGKGGDGVVPPAANHVGGHLPLVSVGDPAQDSVPVRIKKPQYSQPVLDDPPVVPTGRVPVEATGHEDRVVHCHRPQSVPVQAVLF